MKRDIEMKLKATITLTVEYGVECQERYLCPLIEIEKSRLLNDPTSVLNNPDHRVNVEVEKVE